MLRGESPTIYGDGKQSRDFTHVANVVQANLLAATALGDTVGRVFNVACGQRYTLLDLIAALNDILGVDIELAHAAPRPSDLRHSLADVSAAQETLGYEPGVDFHEGLRRTVGWYERMNH